MVKMKGLANQCQQSKIVLVVWTRKNTQYSTDVSRFKKSWVVIMAYPRRNGAHQLLGLSSREENTFEIPLKTHQQTEKVPQISKTNLLHAAGTATKWATEVRCGRRKAEIRCQTARKISPRPCG